VIPFTTADRRERISEKPETFRNRDHMLLYSPPGDELALETRRPTLLDW
jgi:hypothetical protein